MGALEIAQAIKDAKPSAEITVANRAQYELALIAIRRLGRQDINLKIANG